MKTQPISQFKAKFKTPKIIRCLIAWQRKNFGLYCVKDSYGTFQVTLTERHAIAWLPHCSPDAKVIQVWTGKTIAQRTWARA